MRKAMANAEVGDDVYGEDPTVRALEEATAQILGKEAAVFVVTGTMANQVAIRSHTEAGDAILGDHNSHIFTVEAGSLAAICGVFPIDLRGSRGVFSEYDLANVIDNTERIAPSAMISRKRLICIENTHNFAGGKVWQHKILTGVIAYARARNLKLHLDGARLWNASAATGISEQVWASGFDSVAVCHSKGLGAPMGSCLAGSFEFVDRARRFKQLMGGGVRQAGIVAAGALYGLRNHRARLGEDHENATRLAKGLANMSGIDIDVTEVETNIVCFRVSGGTRAVFLDELRQHDLHMLPIGQDMIRAVLRLDIARSDVDTALAIVSAALR
jgi:threonine aldolase